MPVALLYGVVCDTDVVFPVRRHASPGAQHDGGGPRVQLHGDSHHRISAIALSHPHTPRPRTAQDAERDLYIGGWVMQGFGGGCGAGKGIFGAYSD